MAKMEPVKAWIETRNGEPVYNDFYESRDDLLRAAAMDGTVTEVLILPGHDAEERLRQEGYREGVEAALGRFQGYLDAGGCYPCASMRRLEDEIRYLLPKEGE